MHLIQKQQIEITAASPQLARQAQEAIQDLFASSLLRRMERLFSAVVDEQTVLTIDRVTLDLGVVSMEEFEGEVLAALRAQLTSIEPHLTHQEQPAFPARTEQDKRIAPLPASTPPAQGHPAPAEMQVTALKTPVLDALIYFLRQGVFPWWFTEARTVPSLERVVQRVLDQSLGPFVDYLRRSDQRLVRRLAHQLELPELLRIVGALDTNAQQGFERLAKRIHTLGEGSDRGEKMLRLKKLVAASILTISKGGSSLPESLLAPARTLLTDVGLAPNEWPGLLAEAKNTTTQPEPLGRTEKDLSLDQPAEDSEMQGLTLANGRYLHTVGWVLVAPFLPRYLDHLQLLRPDRKAFKTVDLQARAVLLTQYLATERTQIPEYELLLNKIVCGYPLAETLANRLQLTSHEQEQTTALLQAVISHWGALGDSSLAALRETFFQREGKLIEEDQHWKLIVERRSLDILLDRIPWSFKYIQLPWMPKPLVIDW